MAKLDFPSFGKHLSAFDFARRTVAELGSVVAIQMAVSGGWSDEPLRESRAVCAVCSLGLISE